MPRPTSNAAQVVLEACRRFPDVPSKTLARYLIEQQPFLFDRDVEKARDKIRYYRGARGKRDASYKRFDTPPMPKTAARTKRPYKLSPGLWGILSDVHIPYHDETALTAAVKYLKQKKCKGIFLNGDIHDCEGISPWTPTRRRDFIGEVEQVCDFLDWLKGEFPKAQIVWKPGNHEDRLDITYRKCAPQLADLPTSNMETILALHTRGIEYLYRKQKVMAGKLPVFHGHEFRGGSMSVNPARWLFLKAKAAAMCSHFHRSSQHDETNVKGELMTVWSLGCLCDLQPDYCPEANNWTQGFATIEVRKGGWYEVTTKRIYKGEVL